MLEKEVLEKYIFENIPISKALGLKVEKASLNEIVLSAPIFNNINHKKTVFGGSLHAIATLACWSMVHNNLNELSIKSEIVITHSEVKYLIPVVEDFNVVCIKPESNQWDKFIRALNKKGIGRIILHAAIRQYNKIAVHYQGTFVAIHKIKK